MLTNAKLPRYFGRRSKVRNEVVVVHGRMVHYTGPFVKGNGPLLIYSWSMIRRRQKYVDQYPDHTVATIHQRLMVALQAEIFDCLSDKQRDAWIAAGKAMVPEERKMGHAVFFEMGEPRK